MENMNQQLKHRRATLSDLRDIVGLLLEDDLGQTRETSDKELKQNYIDAFEKINSDPNHYLMIVQKQEEIVGTCHLTIMPSLTFTGSIRMQIEAVRVLQKYRGHKIGEWMIETAIGYGKLNGVSIVQLTTNIQRARAKQFYERLGFESTHVGMKKYI